MSNDTPMKRCSKCGEPKLATTEYFYANKDGEYGLRSDCKACRKVLEHDRAQTPERREKQHQYEKDYYQKHGDVVRTRKRVAMRNRRKDPEKGEIIRQQNKKRQSKPGWALMHKACHQRRRARKQGRTTNLSTRQLQRCFEYFNHRCAVCGRPAGLWHTLAQEHWQSLSKGGTDTPNNIIPMCHSRKDGVNSCNNTKSNRDPIEWLNDRVGKKQAGVILARILAYFDWVKQQDGD